jgi:AcrR family transcriptional regulator
VTKKIADTKQRRQRGRPSSDKDLQVQILDSAEEVFAEHGFAGGRLRDIAARADVNQALVNYYFESKSSLFDEVFLRRGTHISDRREALLDELLSVNDTPSVEQIILAYLTPQWDMKYSGRGGAAFVKLQARLHAEPEEHALRLRREVYDESAKRYITALHNALPYLSKETVGLRMAFVIGSYLFMLNDVDRLNDLTENQIGLIEKDQMLTQLSTFLCAGLMAPEAP